MPKKESSPKGKSSAKTNERLKNPGANAGRTPSEKETSQSAAPRRKEFSVHDPKSPSADA